MFKRYGKKGPHYKVEECSLAFREAQEEAERTDRVITLYEIVDSLETCNVIGYTFVPRGFPMPGMGLAKKEFRKKRYYRGTWL